MSKKWLKTACAAIMAAALTVSGGAAVFAEETDTLDILGSLSELEGADIEMPAMTTEIKISGSIPAESLGDLEINADLKVTADPSAGAQSLTGTVSTSGVSYSLAGYFDDSCLMVQIPGLPKVLSYNFNSDAASSPLAQMVGVKPLETINKYLQLLSKSMNDKDAAIAYTEQLAQCFMNAVNNLEIGTADEKECIVGSGTKVLPGMSAKITKDTIASFANEFLQVTLPNGQSMEEYIKMMAEFANSMDGDDSEVDVTAYLQSMINELPDFTGSVYMDESMPREISLEAEGSVVALQFRGEEIPFTDIYLVTDDEVVGSVITELTETGLTSNIFVGDGEEAMNIATVTFNAETYEYSISTPYLPGEITGQFQMEGNTFTCTANYQGLSIEISAYEGGEVTKPEGEVLELTEMSGEDFQAISQSLGSLFSSLENAA